MDNLASHLVAWRRALLIAELNAEVSPPDIDDKAYWRHEINVLDRIAASLPEPAQDVTPVEIECFKSTPIRRMSTGGNYVNLTADVVLLTDHQSAIAQLKAERDAAIASALASIDHLTDIIKSERVRATQVEASLAEMQRELDKLSDPNAVHINMLRGTIAKPSFEQIQHLYPTELTARQKREAGLRVALLEIIHTGDAGTTGDGHSDCIGLAQAALNKEGA